MKVKKIIFKTLLLSFILLFSTIPSLTGLSNQSLRSTQMPYEKNLFKVNNLDENSIEINLELDDFKFEKLDTEYGYFTSVSIDGFSYILNEGQAKLPCIRRLIEIPFGSNYEIKIKSLIWDEGSLQEFGMPERIIPSQQSIEKIPSSQNEFLIDEDYYNINSFLPADNIEIADSGNIRSRNFFLIEICPVKYKPINGQLRLLRSCELVISLENTDLDKTYENIERYSSSAYEKVFGELFENYGFYEKGLLKREQEGMLFIVYDSFTDEIQDLVDLKDDMGYDTTVTKTSDIPGGPSKENIKAYIQDAYDTWTIPPTYVLLVGDTGQVPTYPGTTGPGAADLYFVTVDGSDFIPDIFIGRFPGSTELEIEAMVEKTVYYQEASFPSDDWIKKGAFIASSDHGQLAEETHNYVIDNFLDPNGYTCDKIYEASGGSTTDISTALNEGRSLCVYSGHGYSYGWSCVSFGQTDIQNLNNNGMYPFVCSHACSTNTFEIGECFGETWVREEDKGALAFWGASDSTYWDEDDILERATFQSWREDGFDWIGGMTDMGLMYLYENYSGGGMTKYYFEAYNIMGDPSVRLWSESPSEPPIDPDVPEGPNEWIKNQDCSFSVSTTDPEEDPIYYMFDWGDGTSSQWLGPYNSGQEIQGVHKWSELGSYEIRVIAKDSHNQQSSWSDPLFLDIVENQNPNPPTINGPTIVRPKKLQTYQFTSIDPEGNDLYYYVIWGDGHVTDYEGPYASGETVEFEHSWGTTGEYTIISKVMDEFGAKSTQNELEINVLKSRGRTINPFFGKIVERLIENYPILQRILG